MTEADPGTYAEFKLRRARTANLKLNQPFRGSAARTAHYTTAGSRGPYCDRQLESDTPSPSQQQGRVLATTVTPSLARRMIIVALAVTLAVTVTVATDSEPLYHHWYPPGPGGCSTLSAWLERLVTH